MIRYTKHKKDQIENSGDQQYGMRHSKNDAIFSFVKNWKFCRFLNNPYYYILQNMSSGMNREHVFDV